MLRKLISAALRRDGSDREVQAPDSPASEAEASVTTAPDLDFPPMVALRPPAAQNDNPLNGFYEAVEADLRAAGYLR